VWGGPTEALRTIVEADLFPGIAVLLLCMAALVKWRENKTGGRILAGYLALAVCAALVALGPEIRLFGTTLISGPFAWLREIDVFRMIRVPARASVFLGVALSMLAAFGLDRIRPLKLRVALLALALIEALNAPLNVVAADRCVSSEEPVPAVSAWLAAQSPDTPIIELPILPNDGLFQRPKFDDSVYLLRSTAHWQRLVNGYAGTEPPQYAAIRESMKEFPTVDALNRLRAIGVRYAVVHLRGFGPNRRQALEERLPAFSSELRTAARFGDDLILEIHPPAPPGS